MATIQRKQVVRTETHYTVGILVCDYCKAEAAPDPKYVWQRNATEQDTVVSVPNLPPAAGWLVLTKRPSDTKNEHSWSQMDFCSEACCGAWWAARLVQEPMKTH